MVAASRNGFARGRAGTTVLVDSAAVSLLLGVLFVAGPYRLTLAGTLLLFAFPAPLLALLCLGLRRRDAAEEPRRRSARVTGGLLIVLASAAVPVALVGMTGWALYDSHAYASRYGYTVRTGLPKRCTIAGDRVTCRGRWLAPDRRTVHGTLHTTGRAWSEYVEYYGFGPHPRYLGDEDPGDIAITVLAVDNHAYFPARRVHAGPLTPLGRPPVPWLTAAVFPAILVPVGIGARRAGRRRRLTPPEPAAPSPGARAGPITVTSRFVRVTADESALQVERNRGSGTTERWVTHLRLAWPDLERMVFTYSPRDPTVTLYLHTTAGGRHYGMDAKHLSHAQWHDLAASVAAMTGGRLTLNLSEL